MSVDGDFIRFLRDLLQAYAAELTDSTYGLG
jgi:hypothetical protein